MTRTIGDARKGMTLVEMIVAMLILSFAMSGALMLLKSESKNFSLGSERVAMYQNGRFALNEMEKDLRASGAGAPDKQPQLIYLSDSVVAFNANYWTNTPGDVEAVYYNPDAPDSAVVSMRRTAQITIPQTAIVYPDSNYTVGGVASAAETIIFYFRRDSSTARTDDFVLYRKVNNLAPEVVSTNILATTGTPFFTYFREQATAAGVKSLQTVASGWLPLRHTRPIHLALNDTGTYARIDSIRAIRVSFTVNNGKTGTDQRIRTLSRLIRLPNVGLVNTKSCGDAPIFASVPVATNTFLADSVTRAIKLSFTPSVDETSGEKDVERYVVWRKLLLDPDWGDPVVTLPGGANPNLYTDANIVSGTTYLYAVAAQDCTPTLSPQRSSNAVLVP
jgi:prepilin-type N-terminal cleavage/methylation domain-containing protein